MGIEGTYSNIVKAIYDKPTASIIHIGEKLKVSPLRSGIRPCLIIIIIYYYIILYIIIIIIITIIQHNFRSSSYSNQRRKRNKRNPDQKKRSKGLTVCRLHDTVQ